MLLRVAQAKRKATRTDMFKIRVSRFFLLWIIAVYGAPLRTTRHLTSTKTPLQVIRVVRLEIKYVLRARSPDVVSSALKCPPLFLLSIFPIYLIYYECQMFASIQLYYSVLQARKQNLFQYSQKEELKCFSFRHQHNNLYEYPFYLTSCHPRYTSIFYILYFIVPSRGALFEGRSEIGMILML
jgi:hypothetical protein